MTTPPALPDFTDKVCLITGAGSGIGRATAIKMAECGATLALQDINPDGLKGTIDLVGTDSYLPVNNIFDVSDSTNCEGFVDETVTHYGEIDYVFNCAGVNPTDLALTQTTDDYFNKLVNTNLKGTYNLTRASIPHLRPGGSIVNVSSIMGLTAAPGYAIYCATKFAIVGFTKAMALELGPKGIRVNAIAPGYIDTPTNAGVLAGPAAVAEQTARIALGRMGTVEEVADVVAFLFSFEARYMNGSVVEITGGRVT